MQHLPVRQGGRGEYLAVKGEYMENYEEIIEALTELKRWLKGHDGFCAQIDEIISVMKRAPLTDYQKNKLKRELSGELLFHPKCLGDVYVKDFPRDGTSFSWSNYLDKVCRLCQEKLI